MTILTDTSYIDQTNEISQAKRKEFGVELDIGRHTKTYQIKKFQFSYKVIFPSADIISERKNATFDYKMLHFSYPCSNGKTFIAV